MGLAFYYRQVRFGTPRCRVSDAVPVASDLGSPQCGRAFRREGAIYPSRRLSHLRELNLAPHRRRRNWPHTARRRTSLGDEFRRTSVCHDESNLILLADIGALLLLTHVFAAPNHISGGPYCRKRWRFGVLIQRCVRKGVWAGVVKARPLCEERLLCHVWHKRPQRLGGV